MSAHGDIIPTTSSPRAAAARHCLSEQELLLSGSVVEKVVLGYFVPVLIVFGVMGNFINLTVLMAPGMRSRSNVLLATLAVCDMAFLLFMLPHSLAHYRWLAFNNTFRRFYFAAKIHLIALINWSSAAAIWLILTICMERLIGIRYPLLFMRRRVFFSHRLLIAVNVIFTGALTFYNHFTYDCVTRAFCNNTQIHSICLPVDSNFWPNNMSNPHSILLRKYVRWSPYVNAVFVVFLPTLIVVMLNGMLILTLRTRQKFLDNSASTGASKKLIPQQPPSAKQSSSSSIRSTLKHNGVPSTPRRNGDIELSPKRANSGTNDTPTANDHAESVNGVQHHQQQIKMMDSQKVTLTVCAIVTCFTITQAPSGIVSLATGFVEISSPTYHMYLRTLTTFMIVIGKSLNFVLFCLSSANFRQRLVALMKARFKKSAIRRLSMYDGANTTLITGTRLTELQQAQRQNSLHGESVATSRRVLSF